MAQTPREPPEPATTHDIEALEERLEVHLTVYVDERLVATETRLSRVVAAQLAAQTRTLVVTALAILAAAMAALTVVRHLP
jgi:hypothetical protein